MSETPFRDHAQALASSMRFDVMSVRSNSVRSHGWWKNLVDYGPWSGPGTVRVHPPAPDTHAGIAALFGTSEDQVRRMIAADWYGVQAETDVADRTLRLSPTLDQLDEGDFQVIQDLAQRLAK